MKPISSKNLIVPSLSLFTSLGTLLCCALPSLFVAIGAGAVLAGLISNMPFLIVLSKYKIILFIISGLLILISGFLIWYTRNAPCPADPLKAMACNRLRKLSILIYLFSSLLSYSQNGCAGIYIGEDTTIDCSQSCITIKSEVLDIGQSNNYRTVSYTHLTLPTR